MYNIAVSDICETGHGFVNILVSYLFYRYHTKLLMTQGHKLCMYDMYDMYDYTKSTVVSIKCLKDYFDITSAFFFFCQHM